MLYRGHNGNEEDSAGAGMGVTEVNLSASGAGEAGSLHDPEPRQDIGMAARLLIVDHAPMRLGIRLALGAAVDVVAEAGDVETAIRAAKREQPRIALVGTAVAEDWLRTVRGICRAAPGCRVVVLAESGDADDLLDSVRAGARGFVSGGLEAQPLRLAVAAVLRDEAAIPRALVGDLLDELRSAAAGGDILTNREAQVLGMLRRGHSTARIAERLEIAPVTVRRHISELVRKLGVSSRADLLDPIP